MKKLWISLLLVLCLILVGAGFLILRGKNNSERYITKKITRGSIEETVAATGNIEALVTVSVGSQVSGTIKELMADYNSIVKKDQVVAILEPSIFMAQKKQSEANLASAKANLENSEVTLDEASRNLKRGKELFSEKLISDSEMDTLQAAYESARARLSVSKSQVKQAEAALSLAEVNLGHTIVTSPVDGIVISRNVDVGQTVAASLQAPTLFTIANDLTKMQVHADIPESDVGNIQEGQDVTFRVDAYPKEQFHGKVTQVRNEGIIVQNVVTYDAVIDVDNKDMKLKPGMTSYVSILVDERDDVLKIPNQALRFKPSDFDERMSKRSEKSEKKKIPAKGEQGKGISEAGARPGGLRNKPIVWVKKGKDIVPVEIKIGISDGKFTELVEGNLSEEDEIVIEEMYSWKGSKGRMPRFGRRF